jgi:hypothetical protein
MLCKNCGKQNKASYQFCMDCGSPLSVTTPVAPADSSIPNRPTESGQAISPIYPTSQSVTQPKFQNQLAQPHPRPTATPLKPGKVNLYNAPGMSAIGIWRPFAGCGTRRRHTGWLMDNQGDQAEELTKKVTNKFDERTIPGSDVQKKNLVGRGVIVERRPYFLVKRELVTVGLYIAQFGKDLFVSLASYLKPPVSNARVILVVLMSLFAFYTLFIFPNSLTKAVEELFGGFLSFGGRTSSSSNLGSLLCIVGPLGTLNLLALSLFIFYSIYKFVTEKDILAGLRVTPNEFNEDDLMAIEKAVEQTVRICIDDLGLNPDDLKPIAVEDSRRLI